MDDYDELIEEYPFLKRDLAATFRRYGVSHVLCDKQSLAAIDWEYDFSALRKLDEDERYVAYEVAPASTANSSRSSSDSA